METIKIQYSHCTRFTPGQLDREPFSKYERREVEAQIKVVPADQQYPKDEFAVMIDGKRISLDEDRDVAISDAKYQLMNNSRDEAEKNFKR